MSDFSEVSLLVAFTDFTRFAAQAERLDDGEVARVMDAYYELAGRTLAAAGGRVVKFIGDATLAVFPADAVDRGVVALLELKDAADRLMVDRGWESRLTVKAHFGPVVAGHFGVESDKRYDILGKTVNVTARLEASGVALSVEAFRQLGPDVRQRFKKHTPPVTYIRVEDPHRAGRVVRR
jgi:adenylate cyclase